MAKRKMGISFERHKEIGAELRKISETLTKMAVEFANAYPKSGHYGRALKGLDKALKGVNDARCYAEENLFKDHPDKASTKIYYGSSK